MRCGFLRRLLRCAQAVFRTVEGRDGVYCLFASLALWGLIVRAARCMCKPELLMVVLAKSEQENSVYQLRNMQGRRRAGASSINVTFYRLPTSSESTQCDVLIQTFKLVRKWHLASCDTCSIVVHLSRTTEGLVIHLGLGVICNIDDFSTALQVLSVSFTTVNHILMKSEWLMYSSFQFATLHKLTQLLKSALFPRDSSSN